VFIVVGGLGSVTGSVLGAITMTVLPEALRGFKEYNEFVFGGVLLAVLMLMPQGLVSLGPAIRSWSARRSAGKAMVPQRSPAK
jgi:ABC-type branched-subunit amino acid transport system permease subunit